MNIFTFIAGETSTGQPAAKMVVLSISSAIPCAAFPMKFAEAGAMSITSARCATAICLTSLTSPRSKVSVRQRFLVSVSKVMGLMKQAAFLVIMTSTLACSFTSILARSAILYAAMLPVTPSTTFFPFSKSVTSFLFC